jgi:DNA topoisomerase VI subunit B
MNREPLTTSRQLEFFSQSELTTQIGYQPYQWAIALLKELIDNALDACEIVGQSPTITVEVTEDDFLVSDNGTGLPESVLKASLDYSLRVSDKQGYVSPSRGQQGNALKTLWAAPLVLDGEKGSVTVITATYGYRVELKIDRIAQAPTHELIPIGDRQDGGTLIKVHSPKLAQQLEGSDSYQLMVGFAVFNPHAHFIVNGQDFQLAPLETFKKWRPDFPTSPHWYDLEALDKLASGLLANSRNEGRSPLTIRQFVGIFDGLKRPGKQKLIGEAMEPAATLEDLANDNDMDQAKIFYLLALMKENTTPIKPAKLGILGRNFISDFLTAFNCQMEGFKYKSISIDDPASPCVIETAIAFKSDPGLRTFWGLNFSPIPKSLPPDISDYLQDENVLIDYDDPIVLVIHITMPKFGFTDRGKSTLSLLWDVKDRIEECLKVVAKDWAKLKRKKRRSEQATLRELKTISTVKQLKPKQVAFKVMEQAYMAASNNNSLPASARQIFYQIRPLILEHCSELWTYESFSRWLTEFLGKFPEIAGNWNVTYDPRGKFYEPHTGRIVDLGTKGVRKYINDWKIGAGHYNRFKFALFIEKEGFGDLFDAVNLGNRYDIAIFSTKGFSTRASRELVDSLSEDGVTILCAHDFDCSGINIYGTIVRDSPCYTYRNPPNVIDIGLRLPDIQEMRLESEPVPYSKTPLPTLEENGCSQAEIDFLFSHKTKPYSGDRVELNAMPSNVLIDWLERKFAQYGVTKFIPNESVLVESYLDKSRRQLLDKFKRERIEHLIEEETQRIASLDIPVPDKLAIAVQDQLKAKPLIPWDVAVDAVAEQFLENHQEDLAG